MKLLAAFFLILMVTIPALAQNEIPPAPYHAEFYVPYIEDDNIRHTLDVYYPTETETPVPTILLIHGGGFTQGDKQNMFGLASLLAQEGFAAVAINYRFLPAYYPSQIQDSFCGLAWIHANAENYPFDTSKIVVLGYSAGAYLANMLGVIEEMDTYIEGCPYPAPQEKIAGVVSYASSNIFVLGEEINQNGRAYLETYTGTELNDLSNEEIIEIARPLTPLEWIDGSEPPFLIFHGDADRTVSSEGSRLLAEKLDAADVQTIFYLAPGVDHNIIGNIQVRTDNGQIVSDLDILITFIRRMTQ